MNGWDSELRRMAREEREAHPMPERMAAQLDELLDQLPDRPARRGRVSAFWVRAARIAAAAALAALIILPNVSQQAAYALREIPILGVLVRVVTIREYHLEDADQRMDLTVPQVTADEPGLMTATDEINQNVDEVVAQLLEDMEDIVEQDHDSATPEEMTEELQEYAEQATKTTIEMDYEVVTDTEDWFTLRLTLYTLGGSSSVQFRYYHIDKATGQTVTLSDLIEPESFETVSEEIKDQMREQMEADDSVYYWLDSDISEWNFTEIAQDQNFYWNADGDLVIVFDEYEVAPGFMGCPEFVIPETAYTLRSN